MTFTQMKDEWKEEAKEFVLSHGCELYCGALYITRGQSCGQELQARDIYNLMVEFAIKKQSERGM